MYHFLSGYTAKVAGTEKGVTEPTATFSTCFGAPFMVHHPTVYAKLLGERIAKHKVTCWLVNTGWTGGPYGVGSRMAIAYTRAMVNAAIEGRLDAPTASRPNRSSGFRFPTGCRACRARCSIRATRGAIPRPTTRKRKRSPAFSSRTSKSSKPNASDGVKAVAIKP
jgi:ATP-dependent phosphoenolpyruvate carboxykinase